MKRFVFGSIGVLLSLGIAFVLAEILLRLFAPQMTGPVQGAFDSQLGLLPKPNTVTWRKTPYYTFSASHDGEGRRKIAGAPSGGSRVLFLGDSFTYGTGVRDDESFASRTQDMLVQAGVNAAIVNAGNSGIGTDFELRYFQVRGAGLRPAVVYLFFFGNDFSDSAIGRFFDILPGDTLRPKTMRENPVRHFVTRLPLHDFLMSHSHTVALFRGLTAREDGLQARKSFFTSHPKLAALAGRSEGAQTLAPDPAKVDSEGERVTGIYLAQLAAAVRETGAPFRVFYIPAELDVMKFRAEGKAGLAETALRRICEERKIPLVSLTEMVAAAHGSIDQLYYAEGHWKAPTHALAARRIADQVTEDLRQAK